MASRAVSASHTIRRLPLALRPINSRTFTSSASRFQEAVVAPAPVRKPVGAFRGGLFGFLLGSVLSGAGTFYYVMEEYRVSNELLTEDIYVSDPDVSLYERVAI
ncbi:uncharacterized protein KY384_002581 [Bacidia gigantensis]|uniref:uncharacterized protein n=1 Tax=Bacidia gigantensis TaxID=2732470 RepID=UPI001D0374C5|nr:uncharacterized protein KY384_002581 [Bacidia gigantensis]KAG8532704.1 hypothetical protein KY384_002581 [Bacidia gigantensis]